MRHLRNLEAQSINILREAYDNLDLALAWSKGTKSTVLLWLARKAFNGLVPIPLIQINLGYNRPEWAEYQDRLCREWQLNRVVKQTYPGRRSQYDSSEMEMIEKAMRAHCWTAVILDTCAAVGEIPTSTHHFSLYHSYSEWGFFDQQPIQWNPHRMSIPDDSHVRVHPLLDWTELDVLEYIEREHLPVPKPDLDQDNILRLRSLAWKPTVSTRPSYVAPIP
jgi:sulfate adenylyltransferase subunit 2